MVKNQKFTVTVEQMHNDIYRITKIVGPGVSFQKGNDPALANKRFHVGDVISEEQGNSFGPLITLQVIQAPKS